MTVFASTVFDPAVFDADSLPVASANGIAIVTGNAAYFVGGVSASVGSAEVSGNSAFVISANGLATGSSEPIGVSGIKFSASAISTGVATPSVSGIQVISCDAFSGGVATATGENASSNITVIASADATSSGTVSVAITASGIALSQTNVQCAAVSEINTCLVNGGSGETSGASTASSNVVSIFAATSESLGEASPYVSSGATAGSIAVSDGSSVVVGFQVIRFPTASRPTSAAGNRARQISSGLRPRNLSIGRR